MALWGPSLFSLGSFGLICFLLIDFFSRWAIRCYLSSFVPIPLLIRNPDIGIEDTTCTLIDNHLSEIHLPPVTYVPIVFMVERPSETITDFVEVHLKFDYRPSIVLDPNTLDYSPIKLSPVRIRLTVSPRL
jgi:hypothetical protein